MFYQLTIQKARGVICPIASNGDGGTKPCRTWVCIVAKRQQAFIETSHRGNESVTYCIGVIGSHHPHEHRSSCSRKVNMTDVELRSMERRLYTFDRDIIMIIMIMIIWRLLPAYSETASSSVKYQDQTKVHPVVILTLTHILLYYSC